MANQDVRDSSGITAIITGDIVQSRNADNALWLRRLKKALSKEGKSPQTWEIFRGDSFQIEVANPGRALYTAMRIKAAIKTVKDLDVRMAIGIGEKRFSSNRITESDGKAYVFSGETFESLKRLKRKLAIKTPWVEFDRDMNLFFQLAAIPMDDWSQVSAEFIELLLDHPTLTQSQLAKKLKITQPAVSDRQNRSHFETLMALEQRFRERITPLIANR